MARQPIEKLQGLGQTSSPSASPIDTYSGSPSLPADSSSAQLADALGTLSSAVAQAGARRKVEKEKEEFERAKAYSATVTAEDKEFGVEKLASEHPGLSKSLAMQLAQTTSYNAFYAETRKRISTFMADEANLLDSEGLNNLKASLLTEYTERTDGRDFVQAGAIKALNQGFSDNIAGFVKASDAAVEKHWTKEYKASMFHIFDGARNADGSVNIEQAALVYGELDNELNPYKNNVAKLRELTITNLLAYDTQNSDAPVTQDFIKAVPWLKSKVTDMQLRDGLPLVAEAYARNLENQQRIVELENREKLENVESKLYQLAENNDIDGIQKIIDESVGLTGDAAILGNDIVNMAKNALVAAQVKPHISAANYTITKEDVTLRASIGESKSLEEEINAIKNRTDIHPNEKAVLIKELPTLMQGHQIVTTAYHGAAYNTAIAGTIETLTTSPFFINKKVDLGRLSTSYNTEARKAWDAEARRGIDQFIAKEGRVPTPVELQADGGIYERAAAQAMARLEALNKMTMEQLKADITNNPPPQVGDERELPDGTIVKYIGGDVNDDSSFEIINPGEGEASEAKEDQRYKVTKVESEIKGTNKKARDLSKKRTQEAEASVEDIFDKETATFNLDETMLATLDNLVKGRYERASKNTRGGSPKEVPEDAIMDIVLDQLGLAGISDFEYGGFFGDDADTAGEVAVKKIVDSLMEKYKGE